MCQVCFITAVITVFAVTRLFSAQIRTWFDVFYIAGGYLWYLFSKNYFREDILYGPLHPVHYDRPCHYLNDHRASKVRKNAKRSFKRVEGYGKCSIRTSFWNINILVSSTKTKLCNSLENSLFALHQFKAQTFCKMTKPPFSSSQGGLSLSQRLNFFLLRQQYTESWTGGAQIRKSPNYCTTWSYLIQEVEFSLPKMQHTERWNQILEIFDLLNSMIYDLRS